MSETPQFSVRCPIPLLAKIDGLVIAKITEDRERFGYTRRGMSTRSAVIVELLKEAFAARERAIEAPKAVYSQPTLTELEGKPEGFTRSKAVLVSKPEPKPESMKARTKRLAKFKSPKRSPAKLSPKAARSRKVSPRKAAARASSPKARKAARVVRAKRRR